MKKTNEKFIIEKIESTDAFNELTDQGFIMMTKPEELKSNKNLKKYNVVVHGNTLNELERNFNKIASEYISYFCEIV